MDDCLDPAGRSEDRLGALHEQEENDGDADHDAEQDPSHAVSFGDLRPYSRSEIVLPRCTFVARTVAPTNGISVTMPG